MIVVDASVAVKWFLPETGSGAAANLLDGRDHLIAPDLLAVEVSATLVRGANMVKANREEAERSLAKFDGMIDDGMVSLRRTSSRDIGRAALQAIALGHPVKDCIYLVLAIDLGCPLVTADARFASRAQSVHDQVSLLDLP